MDSLLEWLSQYGYAGLFGLLVLGIVGLPIPDETLLGLSGFLISKDRLDPVATCATAFAGSACGMTISYTIGRALGYGFVHSHGKYIHLSEARVERVNRWFHRAGHWLLTFGYYIPGVRHFTALVAGMSGLEFRTFATYSYPGAALWVASFIGLGYVLGDRWRQVFEVVHEYVLGLSVVAIVAFAAGWWFWRKRKSRDLKSKL